MLEACVKNPDGTYEKVAENENVVLLVMEIYAIYKREGVDFYIFEGPDCIFIFALGHLFSAEGKGIKR